MGAVKSKMDILKSDSPAILCGGEPPFAFGPGGPTDRDLVNTILEMHEARRVQQLRSREKVVPVAHTWHELSHATPKQQALAPMPPTASDADQCAPPTATAENTARASVTTATDDDGHVTAQQLEPSPPRVSA